MSYPLSERAGFKIFNIGGMSSEGHANNRDVILVSDIDEDLIKKSNLCVITISGGSKAVWAKDVEAYLRLSDVEKAL